MARNLSPMELKEVFVALQTGVMDGQENPLTQIFSQKFQEVQKYLSMTGHVYTPAFVTAGASWERFPADVRKILEDTAKAVEADVLKLAEKLDNELVEKMKTSGIAVNQADKAAFVKASKAIYEEFSKEVKGGQALIDKSLALAKSSSLGSHACRASTARHAFAFPPRQDGQRGRRFHDSFRRFYDRLLEVIAVVLIVAVTVIVVLGFTYRWAGYSLVWYDEVASISLAWLTYFASALAAMRGAHLGFSGFVNSLPAGLRVAATLFSSGITIFLFVLTAWVGTKLLPIIAGITLVSLPNVSQALVMSAIPVALGDVRARRIAAPARTAARGEARATRRP